MDVLIAEDDENDRFLVARAFGKMAPTLALAFACDGHETIDQLEALPPSAAPKVLLLDLKMPRMNGFQVLEWLLEHPDRRPRRVLVLSSSIYPQDMERSRVLRADLHLTKPHDSRDYVRIATALLAQLAEGSAAPGTPIIEPAIDCTDPPAR